MLNKLLNAKSLTITGAAVLIGFSSLASRLLGVVRDRVLASQFGVGDTLDAYFAAFRIPDTIFNLVVLGALSAAFIPIFSDLLETKKEKAWELAGNVLNILIISLGLLCAVLFFFAPQITALITPGFEGEKLALTINLTRIMMLSPFLLGISSLFGGIMQTFKHFFLYSLAPIVYNLGIILGALIFVPIWGPVSLAYGVILGAVLHMLIQMIGAQVLGFRFRFILDLTSPEFLKVLKMMVPRTMSLAVSQINLTVLTVIATTLPVGSLAIFNLANNLQSFPIGIFGISFAIAAFPTLCDLTKGKNEEFIESFSNTVRQIIFFILPISALFIVLRAQIVRVILGGGLFDWPATISTARALALFSFAMLAQALIPLFIRGFFAFKNSMTPFLISIFAEIINIVFALVLTRPFSVFGMNFNLEVLGLPAAIALSSTINLILLWIFLRMKLKTLNEAKIFFSFAKILLATIVMAAVTQFMKYGVEPFFGTETFMGIFLQGFISGLVGLAVFVAIGLLINMEELNTLISSVKRKLFKSKMMSTTQEGVEASNNI